MGRCPQRPQIQIGKSHGKDLRDLPKTTPERLWEAITDSDIRSNYQFGNTFEADWNPGGRFVVRNALADEPLGDGWPMILSGPTA